jgi:hypothetical protein
MKKIIKLFLSKKSQHSQEIYNLETYTQALKQKFEEFGISAQSIKMATNKDSQPTRKVEVNFMGRPQKKLNKN